MPVNLTLRNKILLLCAIIVVFEMCFVGALAAMLHNAEAQIEQEREARTVVETLDQLAELFQKASMGMIIEFEVKDPVNSPGYYKTFGQYQEQILTTIDKLRKLVSDRPEQVQAVDNLDGIIRHSMVKARSAFSLSSANNLQTKMTLAGLSTEATDQSDRILEFYKSLQENGKQAQENWRQQVKTALVVGLFLNLGLAIFLASALTRGISRRLSVINDNSLKLSVGQPLNPQLEGKDEIASVDKAFHIMATSLREAQSRERAVVENAMDVICSIDIQRKFSAINPACFDVMGYTQEELIGRRFIDLVVAEDRDKTTSTLKQIAVDGSAVPLENQINRKDGSRVDILWSIRWSNTDNTFFCVGHDITARHEMERLKQEFVAIVSHDLATPLSSIQGTLDLIGDEIMDTRSIDGRKNVENARRSVRRLIRLVHDLLDIEKMESGKLDMRLEPVALDMVIERSLDSVQVFADQKGVNLSYEGTDARVTADVERLTQVIVNVLSNAIKFSPPEGTVKISCVAEDKSWRLNILDSGAGVPKEKQHDIFERFKQLDSPDGKPRGGAGLGLAICKSIMQGHHGDIGVQSEQGKGSCFWILIPPG